MAIDPAGPLGHVDLTVADLDRVVAFYHDVLGFRVHRRDGGTAALGAGGPDLLRLTERRDAARVDGVTGLSHFAVLVSRRVDLARLLRRLYETGTAVQDMEDHGTHEAIYLADPEGNGIELACDHPREQWPTFEALMRLGSAKVDAASLLAELPPGGGPWEGLPSDATIGHVFLHVADLESADAFYRVILGFDQWGVIPGDAEFVAAGGYHQHIVFSLGAGAGAPPNPPGSRGLNYITVVVSNEAELARVLGRVRGAGVAVEPRPDGFLIRDPSGNGVLLTTEV